MGNFVFNLSNYQKMKKLFFLASLATLVACNKEDGLENEQNNQAQLKESNWATMSEFKLGRIGVDSMVVVKLNGEIVHTEAGPTENASFVGASWGTISNGTRTSYELSDFNYTVEYVPITGNFDFTHHENAVLAFEDLRKGIDADYNDFVVKVHTCMYENQTYDTTYQKVNENNHRCNGYGKEKKKCIITPKNVEIKVAFQNIKPIAMGAEYDMAFGCQIVALQKCSNKVLGVKEVILSKDVRSEYFNGTKGMLNTVNESSAKKFNIKGSEVETENFIKKDTVIATFENMNQCEVKFQLIYFIEVYPTDGSASYRNYSVIVKDENLFENFIDFVNGTNGAALGHDNYALGIYLPSGCGFKYLAEKESIFNAYPNYRNWLNGNYSRNPFVNPNTEYIYDAPANNENL